MQKPMDGAGSLRRRFETVMKPLWNPFKTLLKPFKNGFETWLPRVLEPYSLKKTRLFPVKGAERTPRTTKSTVAVAELGLGGSDFDLLLHECPG